MAATPEINKRSDNVVSDPMNYSPFGSKPDMTSGGSHLEKRSLKEDWDYVSHP